MTETTFKKAADKIAEKLGLQYVETHYNNDCKEYIYRSGSQYLIAYSVNVFSEKLLDYIKEYKIDIGNSIQGDIYTYKNSETVSNFRERVIYHSKKFFKIA